MHRIYVEMYEVFSELLWWKGIRLKVGYLGADSEAKFEQVTACPVQVEK